MSATDLDRLIKVVVQVIAVSTHNDYLELVKATGEYDRARESHQEWANLNDEIKHSNTDQALHSLHQKVQLLGMDVVIATEARAPVTQLTGGQIEMLAKAEHQRWANNKRDHGWEYGDLPEGEVDFDNKLHPLLCAWEDLRESEREKDRLPCRRLIDQLHDAGLALVAKT